MTKKNIHPTTHETISNSDMYEAYDDGTLPPIRMSKSDRRILNAVKRCVQFEDQGTKKKPSK